MSRPAVFAAVLAVILWTEVSGFGFQLDNETIAAETYTGRDFVSIGPTKSTNLEREVLEFINL